MLNYMTDFIIALLNWTIDIEEEHPRKCYFLLGLLVSLIIRYG